MKRKNDSTTNLTVKRTKIVGSKRKSLSPSSAYDLVSQDKYKQIVKALLPGEPSFPYTSYQSVNNGQILCYPTDLSLPSFQLTEFQSSLITEWFVHNLKATQLQPILNDTLFYNYSNMSGITNIIISYLSIQTDEEREENQEMLLDSLYVKIDWLNIARLYPLYLLFLMGDTIAPRNKEITLLIGQYAMPPLLNQNWLEETYAMDNALQTYYKKGGCNCNKSDDDNDGYSYRDSCWIHDKHLCGVCLQSEDEHIKECPFNDNNNIVDYSNKHNIPDDEEEEYDLIYECPSIVDLINRGWVNVNGFPKPQKQNDD